MAHSQSSQRLAEVATERHIMTAPEFLLLGVALLRDVVGEGASDHS